MKTVEKPRRGVYNGVKNKKEADMVKGILCSSGALITRFNGRDPRLLRSAWGGLNADGLEFMIYPSWDGRLDEIEEIVFGIKRDMRINVPVIHADKRIGELLSQGSDEEMTEARLRFIRGLEIAERLESSLMVLHLWGGPASDHNIERNYSVLADYREEAAKRGVLLTVENVVCAVGSPLAHLMEILRSEPSQKFTVDTKMAEFHGELPATANCGALWNGAAAHLHVNDYGGGIKDFSDLRVLHVGEGHVDFEPFFARVLESGYEGYATVESTSVRPDGSIDFEKMNRSLSRVRAALMK